MLDETIEKLNKKNKVPTIVIDNAHFLFNFYNYYCSSCQNLRNLYDTQKVNIWLITNNTKIK